jgi:hypothetical protein
MRDHVIGGPAARSSEEITTYLAVLTRLAALDGFHDLEKTFINRAATQLGIHPDAAHRAHQVVADPKIPTGALVERIRDPGLRLCLLRDAYLLAAADDVYSEAELRELSVIAAALGIAQDSASAVRHLVMREARLQLEFARLVREVRA